MTFISYSHNTVAKFMDHSNDSDDSGIAAINHEI